ncbi:uncharacterized protein MONBRDRAFT_28021 [Monosiga brevicollis MX1]|uniref:Endonuclease/exonuclease/phosphatase domain-containing protein n=1 Tax=Monosiga brevicollis TaxID=81824 RepID=A9V6Z2_MONBE|nr:uncharacterized protein MONBRDRAFT_28021 [Monosiga brevicollis MX1]EDQ86630.1 predicted protein [Monosiga brevicollis MX1]|eukprot:XP_001748466.1 hypothetical protein [Monosiga brevicollis MX1]
MGDQGSAGGGGAPSMQPLVAVAVAVVQLAPPRGARPPSSVVLRNLRLKSPRPVQPQVTEVPQQVQMIANIPITKRQPEAVAAQLIVAEAVVAVAVVPTASPTRTMVSSQKVLRRGLEQEDGGDYESDSDIDEDAPAYGGSWLNETTAEQRPTFLPMHDKKLQKQVLPPGIVPDDDEDTVAADPAGSAPQHPCFGFVPRALASCRVFSRSSCASQDEESRLLFLQFPDMLPGLMINGQLGTLPEDVEPTGAERCANLRDLPAGIIGRLRIRRSGKMELVMGNVTFEVHEGTRASHLQELMMIDHDGGQPTAYNLGQVDRKFIVAPDVSTAFQRSVCSALRSAPCPYRIATPRALGSSAADSHRLRLITFNVLAPCHKRVGQGLRESAFASVSIQRQSDILSFLCNRYQPTALCLQEFWFDSSMHDLYREQLGQKFHRFMLKRPGRIHDGLLMALEAPRLQVISQRRIVHDYAYRVTLMLHLRFRPHTNPDTSDYIDFILCNTHLTYPARTEDHDLRLRHTRHLLTELDAFERECGLRRSLVVGDFNGNLSSASCRAMLEYVSLRSYLRVMMSCLALSVRGLPVVDSCVASLPIQPRVCFLLW